MMAFPRAFHICSRSRLIAFKIVCPFDSRLICAAKPFFAYVQHVKIATREVEICGVCPKQTNASTQNVQFFFLNEFTKIKEPIRTQKSAIVR